MSKHTDGRFTGASGGEIYWQAWVPDEVGAVVVLAHGYGEHSGRYAHVAARLNDAGYAVYTLDHQGHGKSAGTKGNIGRMAWVTTDLQALRDRAEDAHPGVPVFLLAHSLGGLIALDYVIGGGEQGLAGLVLSGAAVDPSVGTKLELMVAPILSKIAPNLGAATLDVNAVSRDPAVVAAYEADPLNYHGRVRARSGAESLQAIARVAAGVGKLTLPVLVMHGSEDKLVSPKGSTMVHEGVSSNDKTLKLYDGLFHEIFNEPEQDVVLDDVVTWLDEHAG